MPEFFDHSLPPSVTLVIGRSGSGKTSFCYRLIVNALTPQDANPEPVACVFIYDWKREAENRLGIPAVTTEAGCEAALQNRIVVFNPHSMFPGTSLVPPPEGGEKILNDYRLGVRWFCDWAFAACKRGPGPKLVYLDELREFQSTFRIPPELGRLARMGRAVGCRLLTSTQFPRDYHKDLRSSVTEWVCFNCSEPVELDAVRPYFSGVDVAAGLPRGEFVAFNRDSAATLRGKLF